MVTDLLDWDGTQTLRRICGGVYEALYEGSGDRVSATAHTYSFGAGLLKDSSASGALVHTPGSATGRRPGRPTTTPTGWGSCASRRGT